MTEYQRLRLQELVDQYVRGRSKAGAVSVAAACKAIRTVMPDCPLAEQDLEDQIFQAAMRASDSAPARPQTAVFPALSLPDSHPLLPVARRRALADIG